MPPVLSVPNACTTCGTKYVTEAKEAHFFAQELILIPRLSVCLADELKRLAELFRSLNLIPVRKGERPWLPYVYYAV